jgi:hypothetical protein
MINDARFFVPTTALHYQRCPNSTWLAAGLDTYRLSSTGNRGRRRLCPTWKAAGPRSWFSKVFGLYEVADLVGAEPGARRRWAAGMCGRAESWEQRQSLWRGCVLRLSCTFRCWKRPRVQVGHLWARPTSWQGPLPKCIGTVRRVHGCQRL